MKKYLYFSGKLGNHKLFIWKYDLETLDMEEIIFDCIDITTFDGFISINDNYVFLTKDIVYIIKDNQLKNTLKLEAECNGLYSHNGEIYTTFRNNFGRFLTPKFEAKCDTLSYSVYDGVDSCNNIDIFVCGAGRNERVTLYDEETKREIPSSFYMVYNNNTIVKLMNCKSTKIKMTVTVNEKSSLKGIVVKNNRMFLR